MGVLLGFAIIGAVILAGYIAGRSGVLGEHARFVLSRLAFFVLSPCLLFTVLADADVHLLFSSMLVVSLLAAVCAGLLFAIVARLFIGIPVALYVLGDAAVSAPVILLQLLVLAPIALTILDVQERGRTSVVRVLLRPLSNPIIVGSALGVLLAVFGVSLPEPVMGTWRGDRAGHGVDHDGAVRAGPGAGRGAAGAL